jgi:hypothetical protein
MKKLLILLSFCFTTNIVIAEGSWPTFSNQEGAANDFAQFLTILQNPSNKYSIDQLDYMLASCPDDLKKIEEFLENKSLMAEMRPGEAEEDANINSYRLYIADVLQEDLDEIKLKREPHSEEEVNLDDAAGKADGADDDESPDSGKKKKNGCQIL